MSEKKTARTGGTAQGGHSGNEHTKHTMPGDGGQVIYTPGGKVAGIVRDGVFRKRVNAKLHMLRRPVKAWAYDVTVFDEVRALGVHRLEVADAETGMMWDCELAQLATYCKSFNGGHGEQLYLPLGRWHENGKPGPDAEPDPNAPGGLSRRGGHVTAPTTKTAAVQLFSALDGVRVDTLPELSPTAWEALDLYRRGFNVFPQPFAKKAGYPWNALKYCRLAAEDLPALFHYRCNLVIMTGRTSGYLFVIDCETAREFERQRAMLRAIGVTAWEVRTGGGGGHLYLRSADGEVANLSLSKARALGLGEVEVRGNSCYVLAPPSVHQGQVCSTNGCPVTVTAHLSYHSLRWTGCRWPLAQTHGNRARIHPAWGMPKQR